MRRALPHLAAMIVGLVVLVLCSIVVDGDRVAPFETGLFRVVNGLPGFIYWPVWVFMQLGNLLAVPAAVVVALILRRWSMSVGFAIVGVGKFFASRLVKQAVTRHRPASVISDVILRGDASPAGLAFVSGHAVIAVGLATVLHPRIRGRTRAIAWTLAALVCIGRVYVGAHLPLDVIAGAGLGLAIGSLANLLLLSVRRS